MDKYFNYQSLTLTLEKNEDSEMKSIKWSLTSDVDYLEATHRLWGSDNMYFKFPLEFGDIMTPKITTVKTIKKPLKCKMYKADYVSQQQCLVYEFYDADFTACPTKCIPIQMTGNDNHTV